MQTVITVTVVGSCVVGAGAYITWMVNGAMTPQDEPEPYRRRHPELVPDERGRIPGTGYTEAPKARVSGPLDSDDPDNTAQLVVMPPPERPQPYTPPTPDDTDPTTRRNWDETWGLPEIPLWDPEQTQPTPMIYDDEYREC